MRLVLSALTFAITLGTIFLAQNTVHQTTLALPLAQVASPWLTGRFAPAVAPVFGKPGPGTSQAKRPAENKIGTGTPGPVYSPLVVTTSTPVPAPTASPAPSRTPTATASKTASPTATATPTPLIVIVTTVTLTPPAIITSTPTPSPAPTLTPTATATAIPTATPTPTPTETPTPVPTATPTPTPTATPTYNISLVTLTSPIKRGNAAELKILTNVGAQCNLTVTLPSGSISGAKDKNTGIKLTDPVTTDAGGYLDWQWTVGGSTTPGTANLKIGCSKDSQAYNATLQMEITQ